MDKETLEKLSAYYRLKKELEILISEKASLEEAKRLIEKCKNRKIYRFLGPLAIEVTYNEAKQFIEDHLEILELRIKKIEKELHILSKELRNISF